MDWTRTWIIGAGESERGLDLEKLRGRGVILGVNEMGWYRKCDAFFTLDRGWSWHAYHNINRLTCETHIAKKSDQSWPNLRVTSWWERVNSEEGKPCFEPGKLSSGISGAARSGLTAINLAVQMGAKRIFLFGFDMHEDYRYSIKPHVLKVHNIPRMLKNFALAAPYYRERGVEIFNANPWSAVSCFPRISHGEAYNG